MNAELLDREQQKWRTAEYAPWRNFERDNSAVPQQLRHYANQVRKGIVLKWTTSRHFANAKTVPIRSWRYARLSVD